MDIVRDAVEGAFTGPDEQELLVVEQFGGRILSREFELTHLFGLIDGDGRHRILWLSNTDYTFQTLCRDPARGVNNAIFLNTGSGGSCCPGDIVYMYYDPESETMAPGFVEEYRKKWGFLEQGDAQGLQNCVETATSCTSTNSQRTRFWGGSATVMTDRPSRT